MLQGLGIELIVHLGQLRARGAGQLALRPVLGARVILHAEEIIPLNERQVMTEFLVPGLFGEGFSPRQGLQIMK